MNLPANNNRSLRVRFALGFGILFTVFLAGALIFIYISFSRFRKDEFDTRLKDRAQSTYNLLVEKKSVDSTLLHEIENNTVTGITPRVRVMVFEDSNVIYRPVQHKDNFYNAVLFSNIRLKKELYTTRGDDEMLGLYKEANSKHYFIIAAGYDKYGNRKLVFLKWMMSAVYISGLLIGWTVIYFFVKRAIKPLDILKNNLNNITHNNLHIRLPETGQGEEVNSLSANFNQMLSRLEQSFNFQRDFVHYASHELRTPLTAMVGLTESSLNNTKSSDQFREIMKQLLNQQKGLTDITNSLLLLSDKKIASNGHEYPMVRLDEVIFRSVEIMQDLFPDAEIEVSIEGNPSNESFLLIHANEPLILMAFNNLVKNALLYSPDKKVKIVVKTGDNEKEIKFINSGDYFSSEEKGKMFTPFYRASNSAKVKGNGLGLALVKQIVQLHEAAIKYSYENEANIFTVTFA